MNILINNKIISIYPILNFQDKIKYLNKDYKLYKNKNYFHTFFSNKHTYLIIDEKNSITHIYQNIPKYKIINTFEARKNTSLLVLPNKTSINFKIGDIIHYIDHL